MDLRFTPAGQGLRESQWIISNLRRPATESLSPVVPNSRTPPDGIFRLHGVAASETICLPGWLPCPAGPESAPPPHARFGPPMTEGPGPICLPG